MTEVPQDLEDFEKQFIYNMSAMRDAIRSIMKPPYLVLTEKREREMAKKVIKTLFINGAMETSVIINKLKARGYDEEEIKQALFHSYRPLERVSFSNTEVKGELTWFIDKEAFPFVEKEVLEDEGFIPTETTTKETADSYTEREGLAIGALYLLERLGGEAGSSLIVRELRNRGIPKEALFHAVRFRKIFLKELNGKNFWVSASRLGSFQAKREMKERAETNQKKSIVERGGPEMLKPEDKERVLRILLVMRALTKREGEMVLGTDIVSLFKKQFPDEDYGPHIRIATQSGYVRAIPKGRKPGWPEARACFAIDEKFLKEHPIEGPDPDVKSPKAKYNFAKGEIVFPLPQEVVAVIEPMPNYAKVVCAVVALGYRGGSIYKSKLFSVLVEQLGLSPEKAKIAFVTAAYTQKHIEKIDGRGDSGRYRRTQKPCKYVREVLDVLQALFGSGATKEPLPLVDDQAERMPSGETLTIYQSHNGSGVHMTFLLNEHLLGKKVSFVFHEQPNGSGDGAVTLEIESRDNKVVLQQPS